MKKIKFILVAITLSCLMFGFKQSNEETGNSDNWDCPEGDVECQSCVKTCKESDNANCSGCYAGDLGINCNISLIGKI